MIGPGKYDDLCTYVREQSGAVAALVIVFGGNRGEGFSVQAPLSVQAMVPQMLRELAAAIEGDQILLAANGRRAQK